MFYTKRYEFRSAEKTKLCKLMEKMLTREWRNGSHKTARMMHLNVNPVRLVKLLASRIVTNIYVIVQSYNVKKLISFCLSPFSFCCFE